MSVACDYLILAHRWYLPNGEVKVGGIDRTKDYLLWQGHSVALLEHPLTTVDVDYKQPKRSRLVLLKGSERTVLCDFEIKPSGNPWRWLFETPATNRVVTTHLDRGFVCFSADPLAGMTGLYLKDHGVARKSVLHFTDYAVRRSKNPILNFAYQRLCLKNLQGNDLVLCVSKRMEERFRKWHPGGKYMYFPNTPSATEFPGVPASQRNRRDIVLLGVADGMRHDVLMGAIKLLAGKGIMVRLHVIGGGGGERTVRELARKAGQEDRVEIHNFLPRPDALRLTASSGVGVVLYDGRVPWNYYRDSLKIREYAACGIPTVCDSSTGTAEEARQAGAALLANNEAELAIALDRLMTNDELYFKMSHDALAWAQANDKRMFIEAMMGRIGRET